MRILEHLEMYALDDPCSNDLGPPSTILCSKGFWIYTKTGGVLEVYPGVNTIIKKGDLIARIKNIFGNVVDEYYAPCSGIVSFFYLFIKHANQLICFCLGDWPKFKPCSHVRRPNCSFRCDQEKE